MCRTRKNIEVALNLRPQPSESDLVKGLRPVPYICRMVTEMTNLIWAAQNRGER